MFGCGNICVCGQLPRYLWGWSHRPFSDKIPVNFQQTPTLFPELYLQEEALGGCRWAYSWSSYSYEINLSGESDLYER